MKLAIVIIATFISHMMFASAIGLRVLLNKGAALPSGETCSATEWSSVSSTISAIVKSRRRNLRQLQTFPSWCAEKCKGFAKGHCQGQHDRCDGYRRLDDGETVSAPSTLISNEAIAPASAPVTETVFPKARNLVATCDEGISQVNTALNTLATQVSPQCRSVLMAPREVTCLTAIDDCNIQKIRLMNADTDTVLVENFASGMSFCRWGPMISFEAVNDKCVCNVQFNLKNSFGQVIHSRFEFYRPFVLFSNSAPNAQGVVDIYGNRLNVGAYTLEYYPDSDPSMTTKITFNVNNC
jgi:hypothetical protein